MMVVSYSCVDWTRFLAFALQLDWKRGFVVNADLRALHKLASTHPNGQLAT